MIAIPYLSYNKYPISTIKYNDLNTIIGETITLKMVLKRH